MAVMLAALVIALIAFLVFLLVIVGLHGEPPDRRMEVDPPNALAAFARHVMGVHVRKAPADRIAGEDEARASSLTGPVGRR
jgi:hypothetical protein